MTAPTIRQRARREEGCDVASPVPARRRLCGGRRIPRSMVSGAGAGPLPVCRSFRAPARAAKESRRQISSSTTCNLPASFQGLRVHFRTRPRANDDTLWLSNLVEKFLSGLADALHVGDVPYRQIGMGDVPAFGRDLVLDDPVFHLWAANPRPAFARGEAAV